MRTLQRIVVLCLVVILSTLLFYIGREHQIFLDNKTIEINGQSFRALELVRITIGSSQNTKPIELMPRDRDLIKTTGPSFHLKVEIMDEFGEEVEKVIEKDLNPGFSKDIMLSMPLLADGRDDYILPSPTMQAPQVEESLENESGTEITIDAMAIP